LCGRCWANTIFNRCINPCISETWPHVIFLSSPTLRTPWKVNDVKMWKCYNLILYRYFKIFSKHNVRGASISGVAAGRNVIQQKGPLWRGLISHQGKFSIVCLRTSVQIFFDQDFYLYYTLFHSTISNWEYTASSCTFKSVLSTVKLCCTINVPGIKYFADTSANVTLRIYCLYSQLLSLNTVLAFI
jgi:hypothetical protein